jgi:nucleoid DNA-binding protein
MLSKSQIAAELEARGLGRKRQISNVLDGLADLAQEQIAAGEDFTVPGIARISFAYQPALKKGEKYKKGDTVVGFGGIEQEKDADSPARKASVKLRVTAASAVKRIVPSKTDAVGQSSFLKSRAGKAVIARKSR